MLKPYVYTLLAALLFGIILVAWIIQVIKDGTRKSRFHVYSN